MRDDDDGGNDDGDVMVNVRGLPCTRYDSRHIGYISHLILTPV